MTRTLGPRRWTSRAWIICDLVHPKARTRDVMGYNGAPGKAGWTELFFLDEVTALAAGHRPCFYCRRAAAVDYRDCLSASRNGEAFAAPAIDAILHSQRCAVTGKALVLQDGQLDALPDGAMVVCGDAFYALQGSIAWRWSFAGYDGAIERSSLGDARLVTPPLTVGALAAGYRPVWHESACGHGI